MKPVEWLRWVYVFRLTFRMTRCFWAFVCWCALYVYVWSSLTVLGEWCSKQKVMKIKIWVGILTLVVRNGCDCNKFGWCSNWESRTENTGKSSVPIFVQIEIEWYRKKMIGKNICWFLQNVTFLDEAFGCVIVHQPNIGTTKIQQLSEQISKFNWMILSAFNIIGMFPLIH